MSTTENSEFAVPEVVADEKEESKEIKATKRPAEVSRRIQKKELFIYFSKFCGQSAAFVKLTSNVSYLY